MSPIGASRAAVRWRPLAQPSSIPDECGGLWIPSSAGKLARSEAEMWAALPEGMTAEMSEVPVEGGTIHTVRFKGSGAGRPLVALHGFAGGGAIWLRSVQALASRSSEVYLIDVPGFGRSSRFDFDGSSPESGEEYFLSRLQQWVVAVQLTDGFVLMGHSMGAFLSACYTLRHPEHVSRLVLCDPWGVRSKPEDFDQKVASRGWRWGFILRAAGWGLSPLFFLRAAGPWGPDLLPRFRPDMVRKWGDVHKRERTVADYLYHCNAQRPATGDSAFMTMQLPIAFAHRPLSERLHALPADLPLHFVFGSNTWMDRTDAKELALRRPLTTYAEVSESGHHPYADNPSEFNQKLLHVLEPDCRLRSWEEAAAAVA